MKYEDDYNCKSIKTKFDKTALDLRNTNKDDQFKTLNDFISKHFQENQAGKVYVVAYLDYKVLVGLFTDRLTFYQGEDFEPQYLQRLRIFDENTELLLLKEEPLVFKGRLRLDGQGEEAEVVDALQVLWGTQKEQLEDVNWVRITENRGTSLTLPFAHGGLNIDDQQNRVKLKTRNYINYNSLGQAGYTDCRFMAIIPQ